MFESKNLISEQGSLKLQILFNMKDGKKFVEYGYSQSVNVARHFKQMIEEALLNALYKVNYRTSYSLFTPHKLGSDGKKTGGNYNEDIYDYIESYYVLEYSLSYYEDRRYRYEQMSDRTIIYRDEEVYKEEPLLEYDQEQLNKVANERV